VHYLTHDNALHVFGMSEQTIDKLVRW